MQAVYTQKQLSQERVTHLLYCAGSIQAVNHRYQYSFFYVAFLAQLVEQWTLNPWVTGSSPVGGIT